MKKKRKKGEYMRGEDNFETEYGIKPWGDDKIKKEEEKKKNCEEKKTIYEPPEDEYEKFETKQQKGKVKRLFLRYLISDYKGRQAFYTKRIMNFSGEREDTEFWLKQPTVFYQSTDTPERLIFAASTKSNYVFDLKMTKGKLQLYTEKERKAGKAFTWQKIPFAHRLDMIEPEHVSLLQYRKEAKWFKTVQCKLAGLDKKGMETQLTTLPTIVMFPNNNLPAFENSTDDYKKAAIEFNKQIIREEKKQKNEEIKAKKKEEETKKQNEYNELSEEGKKKVNEEKEAYEKMNSQEKAKWNLEHNFKPEYKDQAMQAGGRTLDDRYMDYDDDKDSDDDEYKEKKLKFLVAVAKDQISIVNFTDSFKQGQEFPLVKMNVKTEHDKIEDLFITYQRKKKRITLHYFEKSFHYDGHLKQSTYNQYELSEDFLSMLFSTGELMPNEQSRMIKRIKEIKAPVDRLIDLTVKERAINQLATQLGVTQADLEKQMENSSDDEEEVTRPGVAKVLRPKQEKIKRQTEAEFEAYMKQMQELIAEAESQIANNDA